MVVHNHDRHRDQNRDHPPLRRQGPRSYCAVVPAQFLDELIRFAFDTLGVYHLDLRILRGQMITSRATKEATVDTSQQQHSHLFTVRLWAEELGDGRTEWRGQVQQVLSGETHYFRDWSTLIALLRAMLPPATIDSAPDALNEHIRPS